MLLHLAWYVIRDFERPSNVEREHAFTCTTTLARGITGTAGGVRAPSAVRYAEHRSVQGVSGEVVDQTVGRDRPGGGVDDWGDREPGQEGRPDREDAGR